MNIREFSQNLSKLYQEMSDSFSSYQSSTGWNCRALCGKCCINPDVEASLYEMIPMALKIYENGETDKWMELLDSPSQEHCLMFVPGEKEGQGKCGSYNERPSVCRMFGVAGYFNKNQEVTLSICREIRSDYNITEVPQKLSHEQTPIIVEWSYRLANLDQKLIQEKMPLNRALLLALQKVSLYAQYQSLDSE